MSKQNSILSLGVVLLALPGCKADDLEIRLTQSEIGDALNGETVFVEFEAEVGERFTEVDNEKRENIAQVVSEIERFFQNVDVDVDYEADGYAIEIEGEVQVSSVTPEKGSPWYVSIEPSELDSYVVVSLEASKTFSEFEAALRSINFMLSPDRFQPVEFDLRDTFARVIVSGARIDGIPSGPSVLDVDGRVNLSFEGGIWEDTGAGFLLRIE